MARGTFTSEQVLYGNPKHIPALAEKICMTFKQEGYEVVMERMINGSVDISLTKGGIFKTILGLKSALKITMVPQEDNIFMTAGIGIFSQQAIPTVVALLVGWPVFVAQAWGMVQQSKLDDRAIDIAEEELHRLIVAETLDSGPSRRYDGPTVSANGEDSIYCSSCGAKSPADAKYCSDCGGKLHK